MTPAAHPCFWSLISFSLEFWLFHQRAFWGYLLLQGLVLYGVSGFSFHLLSKAGRQVFGKEQWRDDYHDISIFVPL